LPTPSTPDGDAERWREIVSAGEFIMQWTAGMDEAAYLSDQRTAAAVAMQLIVIGETANRISAEARLAHPMPWAQISALRNRIAHGYAFIDQGRVWQILQADLPGLLATARRALEASTP
jgi:uncharacterized protein with HEPN domain